MQPETPEKPRLTLKFLESQLEVMKEVLIQMFTALDRYENLEIGWYDTLSLWRGALYELTLALSSPAADVEQEGPPPPEESDAGKLPAELATDQREREGAESMDV